MKNLILWNVSVRELKFDSVEKLIAVYGHNENSSSGDLYVCTPNLVLSSFNENGILKWTKDLKAVVSDNNFAVDLTYLSLPNSLCVGFSNGELYTVEDEGKKCMLTGVSESGILAMEWSSDQELLILVTKDLKAVLMSFTFDPIKEVNLYSDEFGDKEFYTVGWGKKETQFHGSEGKGARITTEVVGDAVGTNDNIVKISWRGDGQFYAIGFSKDGIRRFKVFDREGHLQYTSEKQQGLQFNLSWRPSGNVIATTLRTQDKCEIAFFEKNGLKHGGFTIPVNSSTYVEDLIWSSDSEILALLCNDMETNSQSLLLFTSSNYHWFLKQTLLFNIQQKISNIMWDNDFDVVNNKNMHILLQNGQHYTYSWIWSYDHSKGKDNNDDAVVNSIDGKKLLVTGFRQTVVPPPMAAYEIELETNVNSVHFAPQKQNNSSIDTNQFFVFTADAKLIFYEQTQKTPLQYAMHNIIQLDNVDFPFQFYNWYWLNNDTIICIMIENDNKYHLVEWDFQPNKIIKKNVECLPEPVLRIQNNPTNTVSVFLQLFSGDIIKYELGGAMEPIDVTFKFPCPKFDIAIVDNTLHFLGLSHKGELYLDNTKVMNNVSSFFVHTHFLLLTTLQHELVCTKLSASGLDCIIEYKKSESVNMYKRKIERGAKLVIVVPDETRTIFQMPRGNLETIQPRPLSLKIIGEYLDSLKYWEAFDLMRKQRINLNLIYDHDPGKFILNIDVFLEKISNTSWLSLFLSDLENVDVTETMYASSYADNISRLKRTDCKINIVCDVIRTHLNKREDKDSKILPIITSYVKKNTDADLEIALSLIKQLKTRELGGTKLPVGSDEALKFLLYMTDVSHLFDVALGMYDFDLVLLVANKSQKDPKEYVPMLNELNEMDENYRKFTINKHLKRFDRAVEWLARCGPDKHEELRTFVKYHSLYREALQWLSETTEIYKQISDDFGLHLRLKKLFLEAGLVYEKAGNSVKAVNCYKDALEWELAINLANRMPRIDFHNLCRELVSSLKQEKRHEESMKILEQYLDNDEEIILYAIENGLYKNAIRLCSQRNKTNLLDEKLLPTILDEYKNLRELVENNKNMFSRHKERLVIVRNNKSLKSADPIDLSYNYNDSDLYSDISSTIASSQSRGSSRTFRSSKNRRKLERKVASLKEGSRYEDVALVMTLHGLITLTFNLRLQVKNLNIALCWFGKESQALELQTSLDILLKDMKDSCKDIWTNDVVLEAATTSIGLDNVEGSTVTPQGMAMLDPHLRIAPVLHNLNWKLDSSYLSI